MKAGFIKKLQSAVSHGLVTSGLYIYPISEDEIQMGQTKNRPSEKLHKIQTGLIKLPQITFESN